MPEVQREIKGVDFVSAAGLKGSLAEILLAAPPLQALPTPAGESCASLSVGEGVSLRPGRPYLAQSA